MAFVNHAQGPAASFPLPGPSGPVDVPKAKSPHVVAAYYYAEGSYEVRPPSTLRLERVTHLIYAFVQ